MLIQTEIYYKGKCLSKEEYESNPDAIAILPSKDFVQTAQVHWCEMPNIESQIIRVSEVGLQLIPKEMTEIMFSDFIFMIDPTDSALEIKDTPHYIQKKVSEKFGSETKTYSLSRILNKGVGIDEVRSFLSQMDCDIDKIGFCKIENSNNYVARLYVRGFVVEKASNMNCIGVLDFIPISETMSFRFTEITNVGKDDFLVGRASIVIEIKLIQKKEIQM